MSQLGFGLFMKRRMQEMTKKWETISQNTPGTLGEGTLSEATTIFMTADSAGNNGEVAAIVGAIPTISNCVRKCNYTCC